MDQTLPYGQRLSVNGYTCTSRPAGITCTSDATAHGFEISRETAQLF